MMKSHLQYDFKVVFIYSGVTLYFPYANTSLTPKLWVIFSPEPDDAIEHTGYDLLAVFTQTDSLLFGRIL